MISRSGATRYAVDPRRGSRSDFAAVLKEVQAGGHRPQGKFQQDGVTAARAEGQITQRKASASLVGCDLAEIQFGGTIILEIAGRGTSASILQAAQRGRKHLSGIARHLTESQIWAPR